MNYVKARYEGSKRSYCFAAEEDLKPGDEAVTPNGTKVTVVAIGSFVCVRET